jgi:hypothetical protein
MSRRAQSEREAGVRKLFRQFGFRVESVPWIRAHNGEFMAIVIFPQTEVGQYIEFLSRPEQWPLEVEKVRTGTSAARIFLRWSTKEELDAMPPIGECSICGKLRVLAYETPNDPPFYPEGDGNRHCSACQNWLLTGGPMIGHTIGCKCSMGKCQQYPEP